MNWKIMVGTLVGLIMLSNCASMPESPQHAPASICGPFGDPARCK